jgi:anti-sigma factor RsiW
MKSCAKNRKRIVWLAVGNLDARQAADLRLHLEQCEACRRYSREIGGVTAGLNEAASGPGPVPSDSFHRDLVRRLRTEFPESVWARALGSLGARLLSRRAGFALWGSVAVMAAVLCVSLRRSGVPLPTAPGAPVESVQRLDLNMQPTIANYQMVANRSLEQLGRLLTRQGSRNLPPAPIYTASSRLPESSTD